MTVAHVGPAAVWFDGPDGAFACCELPPPTDDEVEAVGLAVVKAVLRVVRRAAGRAALDPDDEPATLNALAEAAGAATPAARPRHDNRGDDARTNAPPKRRSALIQTELGVFSTPTPPWLPGAVGSRTGAVVKVGGVAVAGGFRRIAGASIPSTTPFPVPSSSHAACGFPALRAMRTQPRSMRRCPTRPGPTRPSPTRTSQAWTGPARTPPAVSSPFAP